MGIFKKKSVLETIEKESNAIAVSDEKYKYLFNIISGCIENLQL